MITVNRFTLGTHIKGCGGRVAIVVTCYIWCCFCGPTHKQKVKNLRHFSVLSSDGHDSSRRRPFPSTYWHVGFHQWQTLKSAPHRQKKDFLTLPRQNQIRLGCIKARVGKGFGFNTARQLSDKCENVDCGKNARSLCNLLSSVPQTLMFHPF